MAKKLLIVDDEMEITQSFKSYFEMKGFIVFTAASGQEALSILTKEKPDVVTLDMVLKGELDGVDVLRESKKISPESKIIMLTGTDDVKKEKEALELAAACYLIKPVTAKELSNAIFSIINP